MALATTTLSSAVAVNQNFIVVASATSMAANRIVRVDDEFMQVMNHYSTGTTVPVIRAVDGTANTAHPASANVVHGEAQDFSADPAQAQTTVPFRRTVRVVSYSAAGAIALPKAGEDLRVIINGTGALALTLAVPTTDLDGCMITFIANGVAAHTITAAGGFGANTTNSDVMTFHATQRTSFSCVAANSVWNLVGFVAGAATVAGPGLA